MAINIGIGIDISNFSSMQGGTPSWVPAGALGGYDFVNNRYWNAPYTFTRASTALMADIGGEYDEFAVNVLRQQAGVGALFEGAVTNQFPNPTFDGAVVGVIGSGGALPTGWIMTAFGTKTVHGIGVTNGVPWIELSWTNHTNTSGSTQYPRIGTSSFPAAAQGQVWSASGYFDIVSATHEGRLMLQEKNSGAYVTTTTSKPISSAGFYNAKGTLSNGSTNQAEWTFGPSLPNGQTLNLRFRIGFPQLENSAARSSFADGTRAADSFIVPTADIGLGASEGAVFWRGQVWSSDLAGYARVFELRGLDVGDRIDLLRSQTTGYAVLEMWSGGVYQGAATITTDIVDLGDIAAGITWGGGSMRAKIGTAAAYNDATATSPTILTNLAIGSSTVPNFHTNATHKSLTIFNSKLSDAEFDAAFAEISA